MLQSKKIFLMSSICICVTSGLYADPPAIEMARELGYSEILKEKEIPHKHFPRAPKPAAKGELSPITESSLKADAELLKPKVYQKPEPASMIPFLLNLQERQPDSPKIARKLALTCLRAGQPREALHWFTKVWALDKSDLDALWNMAVLSYRLGDLRKADDFLSEYARRDPYSAWGMLARKFIGNGAFGTYNSAKMFNSPGIPHIGYMEKASESTSSDGGLMIVGGRRVGAEDIGNLSFESSSRPKKSRQTKSKDSINTKQQIESFSKLPNKTENAILPAALGSPLTKATIDLVSSGTKSTENSSSSELPTIYLGASSAITVASTTQAK